jgi:hypothetical protein
VSVKDRWVSPHEQVLNVLIAYWCYGPSRPSSLSMTQAWFKSSTSLVVGGGKLGGDPQIGQSACWGCSRESLFLGSSGIRSNLSTTRERLLYMDYVRYV